MQKSGCTISGEDAEIRLAQSISGEEVAVVELVVGGCELLVVVVIIIHAPDKRLIREEICFLILN